MCGIPTSTCSHGCGGKVYFRSLECGQPVFQNRNRFQITKQGESQRNNVQQPPINHRGPSRCPPRPPSAGILEKQWFNHG
ncbi:hypothetical protein BDV32DRAFT_131739 [Aspergillus pseudonomiae]|nr:hypothetical protein BDV32DRAFT_131739 [Aspergillus pseudonomiae]